MPGSDRLTRGKSWVFQLVNSVQLLILVTCENIAGLRDSSPWLALVALKLRQTQEQGRGGGGGELIPERGFLLTGVSGGVSSCI